MEIRVRSKIKNVEIHRGFRDDRNNTDYDSIPKTTEKDGRIVAIWIETDKDQFEEKIVKTGDDCPRCNGTGEVTVRIGKWGRNESQKVCPDCNGTGKYLSRADYMKIYRSREMRNVKRGDDWNPTVFPYTVAEQRDETARHIRELKSLGFERVSRHRMVKYQRATIVSEKTGKAITVRMSGINVNLPSLYGYYKKQRWSMLADTMNQWNLINIEKVREDFSDEQATALLSVIGNSWEISSSNVYAFKSMKKKFDTLLEEVKRHINNSSCKIKLYEERLAKVKERSQVLVKDNEIKRIADYTINGFCKDFYGSSSVPSSAQFIQKKDNITLLQKKAMHVAKQKIEAAIQEMMGSFR